MEGNRRFHQCLFGSDTIREALGVYSEMDHQEAVRTYERKVSTRTDTWYFDNDDEFFAAYDRGYETATFTVTGGSLAEDVLDVDAYNYGGFRPYTAVRSIRPNRGEIERVFSVFNRYADRARVPEPEPEPPEPPTVFIGHGRSKLWRGLKDHLHEQHGYAIEAYETGARAVHTIRDILERMMDESSFAVLVMTAEDEQAGGEMRARQNVVHEAGLFQGRLGFDRAIVAIEVGVEPFSNLQGIDQLRFGRGNIREIFGDVLATLRREFPPT